MTRLGLLLLLVAASSPAAAQAGDHAGEPQPPLPPELVVPLAPVLSPDEALAAFDVEPGYRVELFAAEPLLEDAVAFAFDDRGRAWVVEMRGYMPDADGNGELEPTGEVAILEDTDGDGRADRRTTFLDGLVLPRAVHPCEDGALLIAPPELALWRDTDGDGRADTKELLRDIGGAGLGNPEHAINALTFGYDGRWHVANAAFEFERGDAGWEFVANAGGGQWGLGFDRRGRKFFDTNSDPLRGDLYPSRYAVRNANHGRARGANVRWAHALETFPARINPGVNRGYQKGTLRDDFTLARFTAACGPHVYEGAALAGLDGSAFVCEPAGNLVKRYSLVEQDVEVRAEPTSDGTEFLRSTDERFRPVQVATGPDGALYVLDFYRGLVQHRVFLTTFLRRQAEERGLVAPVGCGRIWRIVRDDAPRPVAPPGLADATWDELVERLGHSNGAWVRTATRVLVEEARDDRDGLATLRAGLVDANASVRTGALRVLHRLERARSEEVTRALGDADVEVRCAALVAAEPFLAADDDEVLGACATRALDAAPRERLQLILSLGEARTMRADAVLFDAFLRAPDDRLWPEAVLSGLGGREATFLRHVLAHESATEPRCATLLKLLARAIVREGRTDRTQALLERSTEHAALSDGILAARPPGPDGEPSWIRLAARPALDEARVRPDVWAALAWPGRPDLPPEAVVRALDADESARFERGASLYAEVCAACHQDSGLGEPGKAPALRHSPFVLGDARRLVRIVSAGLVGPIVVRGEAFDAEMPAWGASDDDLAAVLTYVRRGWGHGAGPLTPEDVAAARAADRGRPGPWTVESLKAD